MKKTLAIATSVLLLCLACSKNEAEQNITNRNTAPTFPDTKNIPCRGTSLCCLWWYPDPLADTCMHEKFSDSLCCIFVGCDDSVSLAATVDFGNSNEITQVRISTTAVGEMGYTQTFNGYCTRGYIAFANDCPVDDYDIYNITHTEYIPAGMYPINKQDNEYVITIYDPTGVSNETNGNNDED